MSKEPKRKTYPLTPKGLEEMVADLEKEGYFKNGLKRLEKWQLETRKAKCVCVLPEKREERLQDQIEMQEILLSDAKRRKRSKQVEFAEDTLKHLRKELSQLRRKKVT